MDNQPTISATGNLGTTQIDANEEIAGMSIPELLSVLGLRAPVQAGAIKGRVQRRLDALPPNRTYDRAVLKAIEQKLLQYMRDNNLISILLDENNEAYTPLHDSIAQVAQDPARFYGQKSYYQSTQRYMDQESSPTSRHRLIG